MADLAALIATFIDRHGLGSDGGTWLVAWSGGGDSTALLHLLWRVAPRFGRRVAAATVDHRMRPFDAEREMTSRLAAELGIEHRLVALAEGLAQRSRAAGRSLQEVAREERYRKLDEVARELGAARLFLAHHADDQAETVVERLMRGCGLRGLAAMAPVSDGGRLIRPLLGVRRRELEEYLAQWQLVPVADPSNDRPICRRNRVRHELLPAMAAVEPGVVGSLGRMAALAGEQWPLLESLLDERLDRERGQDAPEGPWRLPLACLRAGPLRRALLHRLMTRLAAGTGVERRHVELIERFLDRGGNGEVRLAGGLVVAREYDWLTVRGKGGAEPVPFDVPLSGPGSYRLPTGVVLFEEESAAPASLREANPCVARFNAAEPASPLRLRPRLRGERLLHWGGGARLLSDLMINARIPRSKRESLPVLCDAAGEPLWVAGVARSRHAPALPGRPSWRFVWLPDDPRPRH